MISAVRRASTAGGAARGLTARAGGRAGALAACLHAVLGCGLGDDAPPAADTSTGVGTSEGTSGGTGHDATTHEDSTGGDASTGTPADGWEASLEVGTEVGAFFSVWGPSPALVYAVAGQPLDGGLSSGALWRHDGGRWSMEALGDPIPGLNWVFGVAERRFMVGDLGIIAVRDGDEGPWARAGCGTILPLWGVWAAAPDDAWAVGGDGFNRDPVACHFDGRAWALVELPEPSVESHALYKVWGTATDDVWAVGDRGLIMHWGGPDDGWVEHPSGTDFDLISLWGTGPDEILAVGGRTSGVLSRFDGLQWTTQEVPAVAGLNGVWMAPDGTATVVGPQGVLGTVGAGALEVVVEPAGTSLALHGVFGFDGVERWAVGGSLDMAPPYVGVVLRRAP